MQRVVLSTALLLLWVGAWPRRPVRVSEVGGVLCHPALLPPLLWPGVGYQCLGSHQAKESPARWPLGGIVPTPLLSSSGEWECAFWWGCTCMCCDALSLSRTHSAAQKGQMGTGCPGGSCSPRSCLWLLMCSATQGAGPSWKWFGLGCSWEF